MAYLLKPFEEKDLLVNIELALFNHSRIHNRIWFNQAKINQKLLSGITEKEYEILLDIYVGLTNQQLCDKHFISINTVKTHVKHLFDKFNVKSRTELIVKLRNWN
jgi:DNA-binding CsgD family transcriptional regulator